MFKLLSNSTHNLPTPFLTLEEPHEFFKISLIPWLNFQTYVLFEQKFIHDSHKFFFSRIRCCRVLASLYFFKSLMSRFAVFGIQLELYLPKLLPSIKIKWFLTLYITCMNQVQKSSYLDFMSIGQRSFLKFLHELPNMIDLLIYYFFISTWFYSIWLKILMTWNLSLKFEDEVIIDLAYLTASYESLAWYHLRKFYCINIIIHFDWIPYDFFCFGYALMSSQSNLNWISTLVGHFIPYISLLLIIFLVTYFNLFK